MVKANLGRKFAKPHFNRKKLSTVVHAYHSSDNGKHKIGASWPRLVWTEREILSPK
jgi:hypothetical protein